LLVEQDREVDNLESANKKKRFESFTYVKHNLKFIPEDVRKLIDGSDLKAKISNEEITLN